MTSTAYYERYWRDGGFCPIGNAFPELIAALNRFVDPGSSWLDVGCGDALTAGPAVVERGAQYTGVDVSASAVELASAHGFRAERIGDATRLPFPDESFHGATCVEVFEHLFEPHLAVAEIFRVLRTHGVLFATVPNIAYWRRRAELAVVGRFDPMGDDQSVREPWRDPHIRFFTPKSLRAMLERQGFQVEVAGHAGAFVREWPKIGKHLAAESSRPYRFLERRLPSVFAQRLRAVAVKPA